VSLPEDDLIVENDSIRAPVKDGIGYQWLYNGTPIEEATNHFIKVDTTQNYEKFSVLISEERCQKTLSAIQVVTSIEGGETPPRIICYYPNPTFSKITIQVNNSVISTVRIRDVLGKEIMAPVIAAPGEFRIDLTDQQSGLYLIELMEDKTRNVLRVVKH
jgi:hypothetical protein